MEIIGAWLSHRWMQGVASLLGLPRVLLAVCQAFLRVRTIRGIDELLQKRHYQMHRISSASIKNASLPEQKNGRATSFSILKFFCSKITLYEKTDAMPMKTEEIKSANKALNELNKSYSDLFGALKGTARDVEAAKKLWRAGNDSRLIKIGVAIIMFPEPTPISPAVGACFVAAGAVQKGIQNRAIFLEDITRTFKNTLKDVWTVKNSL